MRKYQIGAMSKQCWATIPAGAHNGGEQCTEEATRTVNGQRICSDGDCAAWASRETNDGFDRTVAGWTE